MYTILSSSSFNPGNLYYQGNNEAYPTSNFAIPVEGNPIAAHAENYLTATETACNQLLTHPLTTQETARLGRRFLNNVTVAHEVEDALLRELYSKIQLHQSKLRGVLAHSCYPHPNQMPEQALARLQPPVTTPYSQKKSIHVRLITGVTYYTHTTLSRLAQAASYYLFKQPVKEPKAVIEDVVVSPPPPLPLKFFEASDTYKKNVVERLMALTQRLQQQSNQLDADLNALKLAEEIGDDQFDQDGTLKERIRLAKLGYQSTLTETEELYLNMHSLFANLQNQQESLWQHLIDNMKAPTAEQNAAPPTLLAGNIRDPRLELLFLNELRETGLHVYPVPGDGHCSLHALFKDRDVLQVLRLYFYGGKTGPASFMPEDPADTLCREIKLARALIKERAQPMLHAEGADAANIREIMNMEISECNAAQTIYFKRDGERFPQIDASPKQFENLEACYWDAFVDGNVTLSDFHLSVLSTYIGRPIHVYSLDYLTPANKMQLLQARDEPVENANPIRECYQPVPVPENYVKEMDLTKPLRLYHSHAHYQAMVEWGV